jgi:hypothetical protein
MLNNVNENYIIIFLILALIAYYKMNNNIDSFTDNKSNKLKCNSMMCLEEYHNECAKHFGSKPYEVKTKIEKTKTGLPNIEYYCVSR